jgi:hypothetical protein
MLGNNQTRFPRMMYKAPNTVALTAK